MAMVKTRPSGLVMESAIFVILLTVPRPGEVLNFTFVAAADCMYFQLHQIPQSKCTYGHCAAYAADAPYRPVDIWAVFKFPSLTSYIVASTALAESVRAVRGAEVDLSVPQTQDKRQCVRQPEELGELVEEDGSKPEGMSKHLLNLAGRKMWTLLRERRTLGSYSVQWTNLKWIIVFPRTFCCK
jgi:hypothetical protein